MLSDYQKVKRPIRRLGSTSNESKKKEMEEKDSSCRSAPIIDTSIRVFTSLVKIVVLHYWVF